MSWDISVFAASTSPTQVDQMEKTWRGDPLGSTAEVRTKITACFPSTDWSVPDWGTLERDDFSFEFNLGRDEPCDGFMIHVRGGGQAPIALVKLAEETGWYLLDCSSGEWLHHCDAEAGKGWEAFQAYRDRVLSGGNA